MNEFTAVIEELIRLFKDLSQVEEKKLEAAKKNRITHVEDCMNQEQAAILRLRGLEKRLEASQEELGCGKCTFRQILDKASGTEDYSRLKMLFDTLSHQVRQFKSISDSARTMIDINLHVLNKTLNTPRQGAVNEKSKWEGLL